MASIGGLCRDHTWKLVFGAAGGTIRMAIPLLPGAASLPVRETLLLIFRTPAVLLLMLAFVGANFVAVIFLTWTPNFLVRKFNFSLSAAGLTGTIYIHLASALAVPAAGWLADRLARRF